MKTSLQVVAVVSVQLLMHRALWLLQGLVQLFERVWVLGWVLGWGLGLVHG